MDCESVPVRTFTNTVLLEIPWARDVEQDLRTNGVPVVMYRVP